MGYFKEIARRASELEMKMPGKEQSFYIKLATYEILLKESKTIKRNKEVLKD